MREAPPGWLSALIAVEAARHLGCVWVSTNGTPPPLGLRALTWVAAVEARYLAGSQDQGWREVLSRPAAEGPGIAVGAPMSGTSPLLIWSIGEPCPAGYQRIEVAGALLDLRADMAEATLGPYLQTIADDPVAAFLAARPEMTEVRRLRFTAGDRLALTLDPMIALAGVGKAATRLRTLEGKLALARRPLAFTIPTFGTGPATLVLTLTGQGKTPRTEGFEVETSNAQTVLKRSLVHIDPTGVPLRLSALGWHLDEIAWDLPVPASLLGEQEFSDPLARYGADPFDGALL